MGRGTRHANTSAADIRTQLRAPAAGRPAWLPERRETLQVASDRQQFLVRIVRQGERYGLNDCLVHDNTEPLVEFYDHDQDPSRFGPRGQFVSRYAISSIIEGDGPLMLHGDVPAWTVNAAAMTQVREFLIEQRSL